MSKVSFAEAFEASGMTQREVAEALGISQPSVSNWKRGYQAVPPKWAGPLEKLFGLEPGSLVVGADGVGRLGMFPAVRTRLAFAMRRVAEFQSAADWRKSFDPMSVLGWLAGLSGSPIEVAVDMYVGRPVAEEAAEALLRPYVKRIFNGDEGVLRFLMTGSVRPFSLEDTRARVRGALEDALAAMDAASSQEELARAADMARVEVAGWVTLPPDPTLPQEQMFAKEVEKMFAKEVE